MNNHAPLACFRQQALYILTESIERAQWQYHTHKHGLETLT